MTLELDTLGGGIHSCGITIESLFFSLKEKAATRTRTRTVLVQYRNLTRYFSKSTVLVLIRVCIIYSHGTVLVQYE